MFCSSWRFFCALGLDVEIQILPLQFCLSSLRPDHVNSTHTRGLLHLAKDPQWKHKVDGPSCVYRWQPGPEERPTELENEVPHTDTEHEQGNRDADAEHAICNSSIFSSDEGKLSHVASCINLASTSPSVTWLVLMECADRHPLLAVWRALCSRLLLQNGYRQPLQDREGKEGNSNSHLHNMAHICDDQSIPNTQQLEDW